MQIFAGIFPRHYDPPDGFTFEINDVSPPIQVILVYFILFFLIFFSRTHIDIIFSIEGRCSPV